MVNTPSLELPNDAPLKRNSYNGEGALSALQVNVTGMPSITVFPVTLDVRLVSLGLSGEISIKTISSLFFSQIKVSNTNVLNSF